MLSTVRRIGAIAAIFAVGIVIDKEGWRVGIYVFSIPEVAWVGATETPAILSDAARPFVMR